MNTGTNSPAYSGVALWSRPRSPARNRPCSRACMQTCMETPTRTGTEAATKTALRKARCPLGFSEMQIAILSLLKGRPSLIAYWQIAEAITLAYGIQATEGAVRGALERFGARGFLVRSRAAAGRAQGNRYAFSADPCPHIMPPDFTESDMEASMEPDVPSCQDRKSVV